MQSRHRRFFVAVAGFALMSWIAPSIASADIIVGDTALPRADSTTFPGGVGAKEFSLTTIAGGGTFNLDQDSPDNGTFSYDAATHSFTIDNIANPTLVKHVWFHMNYTPGDGLPQNPGAVFDPALWPTLTSAGAVTNTGASAISGNDIYMTWDINPQPARETISIAFPNLNGDFGGIFKIEASTICTPEPGSIILVALGGVVLTGRMWRTRSRLARFDA